MCVPTFKNPRVWVLRGTQLDGNFLLYIIRTFKSSIVDISSNWTKPRTNRLAPGTESVLDVFAAEHFSHLLCTKSNAKLSVAVFFLMLPHNLVHQLALDVLVEFYCFLFGPQSPVWFLPF